MVEFARRETPIRVVVDDHPVVVAGLEAMLEPLRDRVRVLDAPCAGAVRADVLLFDPYPDRETAAHRARTMLRSGGVAHSVWYKWDHVDERQAWATCDDGHTVLSKSLPGHVLADELERLTREQPRERVDGTNGWDLGDREAQILSLLSAGMSNREIADELYVSINTVKTHTRRLYARLGVSNRTQAALVALGRASPSTAPGLNGSDVFGWDGSGGRHTTPSGEDGRVLQTTGRHHGVASLEVG